MMVGIDGGSTMQTAQVCGCGDAHEAALQHILNSCDLGMCTCNVELRHVPGMLKAER